MKADPAAEFTSGHRDLNSPAKADIYPVAERHLRMGGGRSEGANPGPHKATFLAYSELFDWKELSAHSPECSQLQLSGSTGFVGDWLGDCEEQ